MKAEFIGGVMDGKTEERDGFGKRYIAPRSTSTGWAEDIYVLSGRRGDVLLYALKSTRDVTHEMNEAMEKLRRDMWDVLFGDV